MPLVSNILDLVGNTPMVKIEDNIYAKCEFMNPFGSIKDRIALNMIQTAMDQGKIDNDSTIIEPTSGNTGIALAAVCAQKGLKLILTMPESMSIERRKLLEAMGAALKLTATSEGMSGAIKKAKELNAQIANSYIIDQFSNPSNPDAHIKTTAQEIIAQMREIDLFVAGVGTAGTISGVAKVLKEYNPKIKVYAIEPQSSAVIGGCAPASHQIQGIGAGFIPKNYDSSLVDGVMSVSDDDAIKTAKELISQKSLLVGISSGANIKAARVLAQKYENKKIVTILCDSAMRYLSTPLFG